MENQSEGFLIPHPPLRVGTFFIIITIGALSQHVQSLFLFLLFGVVLLLLERVPASYMMSRLKVVSPVLLFFLLFFPIYEKTPIIGLVKGGLYSGRLLFVTIMLTLLFVHLPLPRFLHALHALRLPSLFIQLLFFTLRFMEGFTREAKQMMVGMRSRGYRGRRLFSIEAYGTLSRLPGSLLIRALARSERVTYGLLSRGYTGEWIGERFPKVHPSEVAQAALLLSMTAAIFVVDHYGGFLFPSFMSP